jgi:hypothetical protein
MSVYSSAIFMSDYSIVLDETRHWCILLEVAVVLKFGLYLFSITSSFMKFIKIFLVLLKIVTLQKEF